MLNRCSALSTEIRRFGFFFFKWMFNLLNCIECFWHPGTFSEQDSLVCYQKLPLALAQEYCLFTDPLYLLHLSIMCSFVSVSPLPFPVLQVNIQIMWSKDEVLPSVD